MTFQSNVRATFYWKSFSKKASVIALAVTFGTSFAVVGTPQQSLPLAYVFLLDMVVLVGVVFYMTTNPQVNIYRGAEKWYGLRDVFKPILLGLIVVLAAYLTVLVAFGFPLQSTSASENFRNVLLFAVFVGFVEEFMRWTWLQTLPWGVLSANLLWVLLHPEVAPILNGQSWSPFFAVVALGFGFLATAVMWLYETPMLRGFNRYLGVIFAATLHAGFNAMVLVWKVQVVVPGMPGTTIFGPMALSSVTIALLTGAMIGLRRLARRPGATSPAGEG